MASSPFDRESSTIDWCETNYAVHPMIAEYANTFSNCLFLLLPPILFKLFEPYARSINKGIRLIWILYATIGLSSMYFHATLSFLGQMLDELAILWLISVGYCMWVPDEYLPFLLRNNRPLFQKIVAIFTSLCTVIAWIVPWVNAFALMSLGVPTFYILYGQLKKCTDSRAKKLGFKCSVTWIMAVICWVCDRAFCDHWISVGFDYLHAIFHILIAYTAAILLILFAYMEALEQHPELEPNLSFWPENSFEFAVPYVSLKNPIPFKSFHEW